MTKKEIEITINGALCTEFEADISTIAPEKELKQTLDLDSLDLVDVVVIIDETFGVKLTKDDFSHLKTFDNLYTFIYNRINER